MLKVCLKIVQFHVPKTEEFSKHKTKKFVVMGRTMFEVQCSIVWSQNKVVRVWLLKDEHVQVCSMFKKIMFESVRWVI